MSPCVSFKTHSWSRPGYKHLRFSLEKLMISSSRESREVGRGCRFVRVGNWGSSWTEECEETHLPTAQRKDGDPAPHSPSALRASWPGTGIPLPEPCPARDSSHRPHEATGHLLPVRDFMRKEEHKRSFINVYMGYLQEGYFGYIGLS